MKIKIFTAGQERYKSIPRKYYRNTDGILLLYDVEDKESFEHIEEWMQDIKEYLGKNDVKGGIEKNENNLVIYLLGNKIDLINNDKEKVTKEEVEKLADKLKLKYYDISCKWNLNIDEVMARIVLDCLKSNRFKKIDKNKQDKKNKFEINKLNQPKKQDKKGGCC